MTRPVPAPLRVLHLAAGNLYGGVERIVSECARSRALAPAMTPLFAVAFDGRLASEIEASGLPCHRLGAVRASRPHTVWRARRRLRALLRSGRPDVVVCHSSWTFALAAAAVRSAKAVRAPALALWVHDRLTGRPWTERLAARHTPDLVISNSRFTDESVPALYPSVPRVVVYAPVPPRSREADRANIRRTLAPDANVPVILIASRMEAWKGHRELIAAAARIERPWRLWIAGGAQRAREREYERGLTELVAQLGVGDRVLFLGERLDVDVLMHAADVLCQPNTAPEPFGLAFVEALHAGLPVVTTAMGGALEIVTSACGVLVPPGDQEALTAALERLLDSPSVRARLSAAAAARAAALCDPARQLQALTAALASLCAAEAGA